MSTQATTTKRKKSAREGAARASDDATSGAKGEAEAKSKADDAPKASPSVEGESTARATDAATEDKPADDGTAGALTDEQTRLAWILGLSFGAFATIVSGLLLGPPIAVLVLSATAAASVIALFWQSLRTLIGEAPLSAADTFAAFSTGTEEEQKRAVLRAMKDLEYERNVGKISEEDYTRLILRYRTEAKALLRQLETRGGESRAKAEQLVEKRLRAIGLFDPSALAPAVEDEKPAAAAAATEDEKPADAAAPAEDEKPAAEPAREAAASEAKAEAEPEAAEADAETETAASEADTKSKAAASEAEVKTP